MIPKTPPLGATQRLDGYNLTKRQIIKPSQWFAGLIERQNLEFVFVGSVQPRYAGEGPMIRHAASP